MRQLSRCLLVVMVGVAVRTGNCCEKPASDDIRCYRPLLGNITGRVVDSHNGRPVVGAYVLIVGAKDAALTDDKGRFEFIDLPASPYIVKILRIGYHMREYRSVRVKPDKTTKLKVKLETDPAAFDSEEPRPPIR